MSELELILRKETIIWISSIDVTSASAVDIVDTNFGNVVLNAGLATGYVEYYRFL